MNPIASPCLASVAPLSSRLSERARGDRSETPQSEVRAEQTLRELPHDCRILSAMHLCDFDRSHPFRRHLAEIRLKSAAKKRDPLMPGMCDADIQGALEIIPASFFRNAAIELLGITRRAPVVLVIPESPNPERNTNRVPRALAEVLFGVVRNLHTRVPGKYHPIQFQNGIFLLDGLSRSVEPADNSVAGLLRRKIGNQRQFTGTIQSDHVAVVIDDGISAQSLVANLLRHLNRQGESRLVIAPFAHMKGSDLFYPPERLLRFLRGLVIAREGSSGWARFAEGFLQHGIDVTSVISITRMEALGLVGAMSDSSKAKEKEMFRTVLREATSYELNDQGSPFFRSHFAMMFSGDPLSPSEVTQACFMAREEASP